MEKKQPVLVGINPESGLEVYREFVSFEANRRFGIIKVIYSQYELSGTKRLNIIDNKSYTVKNLPAIPFSNQVPRFNENNVKIEADRPQLDNFDEWFSYNVGALPDGTTMSQVIESSIDTALQSFPINVKNDLIIAW